MQKPHQQGSKNSANAIGVMDSGVGGLSVLKHIHALLPQETLFYAADSLYAPYGNKSVEDIRARCDAVADFLLNKNIKALVVACNTATAAAIENLRAKYDVPIIGMEPAVKPAAAATKNGVVGILATSGTLKSAQFAALLAHYGQDIQVVTQACIGLVECVERGELNADATFVLVEKYCQPLLEAGADTIVLGCTHYPFIKPLIERVLAENHLTGKVSLIDTGGAVAKQLERRLIEQDLLRMNQLEGLAGNHESSCTFWTNSRAPKATQIIGSLWSEQSLVHYADF